MTFEVRPDGVLVEQCAVDGIVVQSNNIVVAGIVVQSIPNSVWS